MSEKTKTIIILSKDEHEKVKRVTDNVSAWIRDTVMSDYEGYLNDEPQPEPLGERFITQKVTKSLRISTDELNAFKRLAKARGVTMGKMVRDTINRELR